MTLNEWAGTIHQNAVDHGWWDKERSFGDIIALCHTELSEALEEYRSDSYMVYVGDDGKPEGIAVELVDCMIRILDYLAHEGVDVESIMAMKHAYNTTRSYRHGGKAI